MKLPKAKKLPSGRWLIQVMADKKRVSFTAATEKECVAKAAEYKAGLRKSVDPLAITVGTAIDRYIELRTPVISPATVAGYKRIRKNALQDIMDVNLRSLTQEKVQRSVNTMAKDHSPKSIRNAHGLLSAALQEFYPDFILRTALPQKKPAEIHIPDENDIAIILKNCIGTRMELPILLALWLGLRASEIRGLTWESVDGDYLHIKQAIVSDENGKPALKTTKTAAGDRYIKAPRRILDLIQRQPKTDEYIVHMSGQAMYKSFSRLCEKWRLPHYRFHDLRHASASVALILGIPDKYSMRRMGHATDNMLKTTYQHTMRSREDQYADLMDGYFEKIANEIASEKTSGLGPQSV